VRTKQNSERANETKQRACERNKTASVRTKQNETSSIRPRFARSPVEGSARISLQRLPGTLFCGNNARSCSRSCTHKAMAQLLKHDGHDIIRARRSFQRSSSALSTVSPSISYWFVVIASRRPFGWCGLHGLKITGSRGGPLYIKPFRSLLSLTAIRSDNNNNYGQSEGNPSESFTVAASAPWISHCRRHSLASIDSSLRLARWSVMSSFALQQPFVLAISRYTPGSIRTY
jgi:hypothetical protein